MAAGGQGAPLVPFVDYLLYRHERRGRVALNIGGIANVTVIPPSARPENVLAFDTGPGNMVIDALVEHYTKGRAAYDRGARMALRGPHDSGAAGGMRRILICAKRRRRRRGASSLAWHIPRELIAWAKAHRAKPEDVVRTATIFTALSIAEAFRRFIFPRSHVNELIVAGGGAQESFVDGAAGGNVARDYGARSGQFGVPSEAKEAFAFAVLAYESFHGRANNLPSATGAKQRGDG